jgi:NAD+ diphosphatase
MAKMEPEREKKTGETKAFIAGVVPPRSPTGANWWFAFQGEKLLVEMGGSGVSLPHADRFEETALLSVRRHFLGTLEGAACYAVEVAEGDAPGDGFSFEGLRQVYGRIDEELFWIATRAIQIIEWAKTHQYCGRCGVPVRDRDAERAKECPQCGLLFFPRLAPAIIVLIERGDEVLLARSRRFIGGMYSVLAGFVEPGESLEETVVREVREEVGVRITDVTYFGSQPWPFPHSLMIGFTARYAGGEISIDPSEIEDAGWFRVDHLPPLPGKISIARKLIDSFITRHSKGPFHE